MTPQRPNNEQRKSLWGASPGRGTVVRGTSAVGSLWDANLPINPGHGAAQAHGFEHPTPIVVFVSQSSKFGKAAGQVESKCFASLFQPVAPATERAASWNRPIGRCIDLFLLERSAQIHLLDEPVVPTPRRNTFQHSGAGSTAAGTVIPGDRYRVDVLFAVADPVGFAFVESVGP